MIYAYEEIENLAAKLNEHLGSISMNFFNNYSGVLPYGIANDDFPKDHLIWKELAAYQRGYLQSRLNYLKDL